MGEALHGNRTHRDGALSSGRKSISRVYSAEVAGLLLTPLCADCRSRCLGNPERVVSEHPRLFGHPEATDTYVPDTTPVVQTPPAGEHLSGSPLIRVIVTDIHMPFGSMVGWMVKWAIASIPHFLFCSYCSLSLWGF